MDSAEQASSLDPVLPQDERLPGLALFDDPHQRGRVAELGVLGVQVRRDVLRYHAGRRCTVRIVTDQGSYIVKVFDRRAERVHDVLAAMADAGWVGVRVPRLIGFEPRLQILVTDEFPPDTLETLLARGDGRRAGALAAGWVRAVSHADVRLGRRLEPVESIVKFYKRAEAFDDPMIGGRLAAVLRRLEPRLPVTDRHVLVHASFKPSHLHDCQDAVGLIDWDGYRQGPVEYDMSTFLATMAFDATVHPERADAVDAARAAFVGACTDLVDPLVLQWFEALALTKVVSRLGQGDRAATEVATALLDQAHALLG